MHTGRRISWEMKVSPAAKASENNSSKHCGRLGYQLNISSCTPKQHLPRISTFPCSEFPWSVLLQQLQFHLELLLHAPCCDTPCTAWHLGARDPNSKNRDLQPFTRQNTNHISWPDTRKKWCSQPNPATNTKTWTPMPAPSFDRNKARLWLPRTVRFLCQCPSWHRS